MTLVPCKHCATHVRVGPGVCPHCGTSTIPPFAPFAASLLLGLGAIGWSCATAEPPYGVPSTDDTVEETGDTGDTG